MRQNLAVLRSINQNTRIKGQVLLPLRVAFPKTKRFKIMIYLQQFVQCKKKNPVLFADDSFKDG